MSAPASGPATATTWIRTSSTASWPRCGQREPIHVGLTLLEAQAPVKAVRSLARWARGQVHVAGAALLGEPGRGSDERLAHPAPASLLVNDDILDPGAHPGRDAEHHERQRADDRLLFVARHEEPSDRRGHDR